MFKKTKHYALFIFVLVVTITVMLSKIDMKKTIELISKSNFTYLIYAIFILLFCWCVEAFVIKAMLHRTGTKIGYLTALKIKIVGVLYAHITPFASGGQPAQMIKLKQSGVNTSKSMAAFISKFIVFQMGVTIFSITIVLIRFKSIINTINRARIFIILGFSANIFILVFFILLAFNTCKLFFITKKIISFLHKIKLIKSIDKTSYKVKKFFTEYHETIVIIFKKPLSAIFMVFLEGLRMGIFFSISYFVYRALGFTEANIFDMIAIQSIHFVAVSFIPSPGTIGSSEGAFYLLFRDIFASAYLGAGLILWRGITYYFGLAVSGVANIVFEILDRKKSIISSK